MYEMYVSLIMALIAVYFVFGSIDGDDDDQDGGKMIPAYQRPH